MKNRKKLFLNLLLSLALILTFALTAQANPWASVPSGLIAGDTVTISGGNFAVNDQVLLQVIYPDEVTVDTYYLNTDDQGDIAFEITLDQAGEYVAEVLEASGASDVPLATVIIAAAQ